MTGLVLAIILVGCSDGLPDRVTLGRVESLSVAASTGFGLVTALDPTDAGLLVHADGQEILVGAQAYRPMPAGTRLVGVPGVLCVPTLRGFLALDLSSNTLSTCPAAAPRAISRPCDQSGRDRSLCAIAGGGVFEVVRPDDASCESEETSQGELGGVLVRCAGSTGSRDTFIQFAGATETQRLSVAYPTRAPGGIDAAIPVGDRVAAVIAGRMLGWVQEGRWRDADVAAPLWLLAVDHAGTLWAAGAGLWHCPAAPNCGWVRDWATPTTSTPAAPVETPGGLRPRPSAVSTVWAGAGVPFVNSQQIRELGQVCGAAVADPVGQLFGDCKRFVGLTRSGQLVGTPGQWVASPSRIGEYLTLDALSSGEVALGGTLGVGVLNDGRWAETALPMSAWQLSLIPGGAGRMWVADGQDVCLDDAGALRCVQVDRDVKALEATDFGVAMAESGRLELMGEDLAISRGWESGNIRSLHWETRTRTLWGLDTLAGALVAIRLPSGELRRFDASASIGDSLGEDGDASLLISGNQAFQALQVSYGGYGF